MFAEEAYFKHFVNKSIQLISDKSDRNRFEIQFALRISCRKYITKKVKTIWFQF